MTVGRTLIVPCPAAGIASGVVCRFDLRGEFYSSGKFCNYCSSNALYCNFPFAGWKHANLHPLAGSMELDRALRVKVSSSHVRHSFDCLCFACVLNCA